MNGARTTLEVRLVHCIGSVLNLEAVYTLMRSTSSVLVRDTLTAAGFAFKTGIFSHAAFDIIKHQERLVTCVIVRM